MLCSGFYAAALPMSDRIAAVIARNSGCFSEMPGPSVIVPPGLLETNLRKERQIDGIDKGKAEGIYKGRKPSIDTSKVREPQAEGLGATEIAQRSGSRPGERLSGAEGRQGQEAA